MESAKKYFKKVGVQIPSQRWFGFKSKSQAAEDAAAEVVRQAVESAAPRKTGQLAESIDVFEGIDRTALYDRILHMKNHGCLGFSGSS